MADDPGTVLITGGASGLGRAVSTTVSEAGGTPLLLDLRPPDGDVDHEIVDLSNTADTERAVRRLADRHDGLDAVVTAAAMDRPSDFEDLPADEWERIVAVNLFGTAAVIRSALPYLRRSRGKIVTVASTLGLRALPAATAYAASKHAIVGLTRALALELAGQVGVTMLVPGGMDTGFFDGRPAEYRPAQDQMLNDPRHVAQTVLFALRQPDGCEIRELVVTPSIEPSWP